jgi:hypothetical protein
MFARLTFRPAVVVTAVLVFVAAAGAGGTLVYLRHRAPHGAAAHNSSRTVRTPPAQGGSAPAQDGSAPAQDGSAPASGPASASPGPTDSSTVTVAAAAAQDPDASSVADFLGQYFDAINAHDYQSYVSLLGPQLQQGMTQAQFDNGYRSTADSNETLVGISTASDGDLAAEVTFTSHQDPADSPDQSESCTDWDISLYLAQGGSGYLIDPAPPGYKASYQPCS